MSQRKIHTLRQGKLRRWVAKSYEDGVLHDTYGSIFEPGHFSWEPRLYQVVVCGTKEPSNVVKTTSLRRAKILLRRELLQ